MLYVNIGCSTELWDCLLNTRKARVQKNKKPLGDNGHNVCQTDGTDFISEAESRLRNPEKASCLLNSSDKELSVL